MSWGIFEKEKIMTKENIKTNTSLRYSQYQKRLLHTFSFEKLNELLKSPNIGILQLGVFQVL